MMFAKLHLLVLHFPLALIIMAAVADGLWRLLRWEFFAKAGFFCILFGTLLAIPTVITGSSLLDAKGYIGEFADLGEMHESFGFATLGLALAAAGLRVWRRNKLAGAWGYIYAALIAAAAVLVGIAGHYGGMLAFGKDYLMQS